MDYRQYLGVLLSPKSHPRQRGRMLRKLKNAMKYGTNKAYIDTRLELFELQLLLDNDHLVIKLNGQELKVQSYQEFKEFFKKFEARVEEERRKIKQKLAELKVTDLIDVKAFPQLFVDYLSEYELSSTDVVFCSRNIYDIRINEARLSFRRGDLILKFCFYFMNPFWDKEACWLNRSYDVLKDYIEYINTVTNATAKDKIYIADVRRDSKAAIEYGFQNIDIEEENEFINNIKNAKRIKRIKPEQKDKYIKHIGIRLLDDIVLVKFSHETQKSTWFKPIEFPEYIFGLVQHSNLNIKFHSFSILN